MTQLKRKGTYPSLENTTHNRVLKETSQQASELAKRLNCTKMELYNWLVKLAIENEGTMVEALAQGQLIISRRKDTK